MADVPRHSLSLTKSTDKHKPPTERSSFKPFFRCFAPMFRVVAMAVALGHAAVHGGAVHHYTTTAPISTTRFGHSHLTSVLLFIGQATVRHVDCLFESCMDGKKVNNAVSDGRQSPLQWPPLVHEVQACLPCRRY